MNPRTFKQSVPGHYGLAIEVDTRKSDCRRGEKAHCHLTKNGSRIAQIYVDPYVRWENDPGLGHSEQKDVERFVSFCAREIRDVYDWNAEHGADY